MKGRKSNVTIVVLVGTNLNDQRQKVSVSLMPMFEANLTCKKCLLEVSNYKRSVYARDRTVNIIISPSSKDMYTTKIFFLKKLVY